MAYLDRNPSVKSGRSHASSARSRLANSSTGRPGGDMFTNAASGVFSMLKTSTDTGDIGDLSFNTNRLPAMPRPAHKRRTNVARLSISSHHSNNSRTPSQISKRNSNSQVWDTVSAISQGTHGRHTQQGSLTSLQTMQTQPSYAPEARSPPTHGAGKPSQYDSRLTTPFSPDGRSYSLTQPHPPFTLKPHRSATSLRSQGSGPYPSQRNPYAYPARLKRPGYRAPSPALSDFGGPSYPTVYGPGSNPGDAQFFEPGIERGHAGPYGPLPYAPPQRPNNGLSHLTPGRAFVSPQGQLPGQAMRRRPMPMYNNDYPSSGPAASRYSGNMSRIPKPPNANLSAMPLEQSQYGFRPGQMRGAPPLPVPPYGGQHHLPSLIHTPAAESLPSSSEQGSSAAPSSNPPTPRNGASIQMVMDPVFVDPAFSDMPDEQTEPHGFLNYLKYAQRADEICELDSVEPAATELSAEPIPARAGFVQRIKYLLEDRASPKLSNSNPPLSQATPSPASAPQSMVDVRVAQEPAELAAVRTSFADESTKPTEPGEIVSSTVDVEPVHLAVPAEVVELPEPLKPSELEAPAKLTRALIKAGTGPSSSDHNTATSQTSHRDDKSPDLSRHIQHKYSSNVLDETQDISLTMASSPPYAEPDQDSDHATLSEDLSTTDELDYAIQFNIPAPLRPDLVKKQASSLEPPLFQVVEHLDDPVSPFRPGEKVMRDSLVSPMPTQTLQVPVDDDHPKLPGSFPIEQPDPPSPLHSRPVSGHFSADASTRFSIPPDLSLLNDHDTTSDIVTDVAVRFSMPRAADNSKVQLVNVNTLVEDPVMNKIEVPTKQPGEPRSLRESFLHVDKVAPLQIKKAETVANVHTPTDSTDLSSFIRRSFPRRQSVWPSERRDLKRILGESTTEARFPMTKHPSGRLPGLKEDSQEDMSIKDYRSSGLRLGKTPPLKTKVAYDSLRMSEETVGGSYLQTVVGSYLPPRAPRMTLSELRNIPSLTFSRLDLIDKLNEALEVRSSRSVEVIKRDFSGIYCPSPLRPSSTEALRDRYASFFDKPDDFQMAGSAHVDTPGDEGLTTESRQDGTGDPEQDAERSSDETEVEILGHTQRGPSQPDTRTIGSSVRARSPSTRPLSRPLSPEELVNVCHEVNHLSVPSVSALAERLTGLLPAIKHLNLDSAIADDNAVRETLEEIHHLGHRPDSADLVRSSTGLRQLAAAADKIATNGTHDSAAYEARTTWLMQELPALPEDTERFTLSDSGLDRNTTLGTEHLSSLAATELEVPRTALLRVRSLNDIDEGDQMHPGYPPSVTKRSLAQTTHHSRPWNLDEYYPWTCKTVSIDINFPRPVIRRNTSASTVLRSNRASKPGSDSSEASLTLRTTRARSPLADRSTVLLEASPTMASTVHSRKTSKRSIMGSLSRKIGLGGNKSKTTLRSSILLEVPGPTSPGDRYPSTALLPHNAFNLEEVRSFFSDSTSDGSERRGSFRKHYNILRSRLPGGPATFSASRIHSLDGERNTSLDNQGRTSQTGRSNSLYDDRFTEPGTSQTYEGMVGMGKVEFRMKRVTERLRHVFLKTGEMFRTLSRRNPAQRRLQKERERAEWLDDSLYSGT